MNKKNSIVIENGQVIIDTRRNTNKQYILWVARPVNWKRPEKFLEMTRRIPEKDFLMILHGDNEISRRIKLEAKNLSNLQIVDYISFFEIQKYYNSALCFVNTSDMEGFPNAFIQACLGSTPILSLNINPDEFITKNNLGKFVGGDFDLAVKFLKNLNEQKVQELGNNAFTYVKGRHDLSDKIVKYDNLFKSLCGIT